MTQLHTTPGFPKDCHWCGVQLRDPAKDKARRSKNSATRDHFVPKSHGGRRTVWSCRHCNQLKGDLFPQRWDRFRRAFPNYRREFRTHAEVIATLARLAGVNVPPRNRRSPRFPAGLVPLPPMCRGLPV